MNQVSIARITALVGILSNLIAVIFSFPDKVIWVLLATLYILTFGWINWVIVVGGILAATIIEVFLSVLLPFLGRRQLKTSIKGNPAIHFIISAAFSVFLIVAPRIQGDFGYLPLLLLSFFVLWSPVVIVLLISGNTILISLHDITLVISAVTFFIAGILVLYIRSRKFRKR